MSETPNHGYNVPSEGAQDWHEPLNDNFNQYDTDIEIRDDAANRSDYEAKSGAKFFATDTGAVYIGHGTDWVPAFVMAQYEPPSRSNTPAVAFGYDNTLDGDAATIGGGGANTADAGATVAGGTYNEATGTASTIGGGTRNTASGSQKGGFSTVPGGRNNEASGDYSFAAGRKAKAVENGSFVWADSSSTGAGASKADQFVVQAGGGAAIFSASDGSAGVELPEGSGSWSSMSAASAKSNVSPVDPRGVLSDLEDLDVATWEYDAEPGVTHMGPMARDFDGAFGLGDDPERIANVDADGVALAAIKGLAQRLDERDERVEELAVTVEDREARIAELAAETARQDDRIDELEERLATLEEQVGTTERGVTDPAQADD